MKYVALALVALVAAFHVYVAWFEIFAWETVGPGVFTTLDKDLFPRTTQLAANQGLYNLFLAVGLVWSLTIRDAAWQFKIAACFSLFVIVAGLFAAATVELRPGLIQFVLGAATLICLIRARSSAASS